MPIKFKPIFTITPSIAHNLMRIETVKEKIVDFPLTVSVMRSLRESARLYTTHYSTMIEGNRLRPDQIEKIIKKEEHFPGREREENEVKGYYIALDEVERWATRHKSVTEIMIQTIHALVMAGGKKKVKPTPYRDGQNVIRNGRTGKIVYLPPEAKDVPDLMHNFVLWIKQQATIIPCPLVAAIAHYQFATIHPYYDGNGRTARLLTTFILHAGGYDLKSLYSLEEYYAHNLGAYYEAISIGNSHNCYMGREEADITKWIEYFIKGMVVSFENVLIHMDEVHVQKKPDQSKLLRQLDPRQRKVLTLFEKYDAITSAQIAKLFKIKQRTSSQLCKEWVESGFLEIVDAAKKSRKYSLAQKFKILID